MINMKRRRTTKGKTIHARHSRRRALERLGINLNDTLRSELIKKIQTNIDSVVLYKSFHTRSAYAVYHDGQVYPVVYSKLHHSIVTVLPSETTDRHRDKLPNSWFNERET